MCFVPKFVDLSPRRSPAIHFPQRLLFSRAVILCEYDIHDIIHICLPRQAFPRLNGIEHGVNEKQERGMPGTREERKHQY